MKKIIILSMVLSVISCAPAAVGVETTATQERTAAVSISKEAAVLAAAAAKPAAKVHKEKPAPEKKNKNTGFYMAILFILLSIGAVMAIVALFKKGIRFNGPEVFNRMSFGKYSRGTGIGRTW
jgi:hypothetical protein